MTQKTIACAIRNSGNGWFIINDGAHEPIGVQALSQGATSLTLTHDFTAAKVNTLVVTPDETYAQAGIVAGASVGLQQSVIKFGQNGTPLNPNQVADAMGNFWIFGVFDAVEQSAPPPPPPPPPAYENTAAMIQSGSFTVPTYTTAFAVQMWGAGGGGHGDSSGTAGLDGGDTSVLGMVAGGGKKAGTSTVGGGGLGGTATGGDTNVAGQRGGSGTSGGPSGKGGDAPNGGAGGAGIKNGPGNPGASPGGGGSGGDNASGTTGGGGGSGGMVIKTFGPGQLTPGAILDVIVGNGGPGGPGGRPGGSGARGEVRFSWT